MATSRTIYGVLEPLVEILRPIPKSALVPVLFLFLGIGKVTMITIVVLAVVFPVLINTFQSIRALDPVLLDTGDERSTVAQWATEANQQSLLVGADFQAFDIEPAPGLDVA